MLLQMEEDGDIIMEENEETEEILSEDDVN
jgi:hypothetical protein